MSRRPIYCPHNYFVFSILLLILVLVIGLLFIGVVGKAFVDVGFSPITTTLVLVSTFLGSYINIPILKVKTKIPIIKEMFVTFFGMVYRIPKMDYGETTTIIAVNLGGAAIPALVSLYLLWKEPSAILYALVGIAFVTIVTHTMARPVKGVGVVTPAFISPLMAALITYLLPSEAPRVVAYVSGVLGTLIGADLANLSTIPELGAPVASIGGAGTFDGVFLSGIIAVLLV